MPHNYETGFCTVGRAGEDAPEYNCMACDEPYWIDCHDAIEALYDFAGIELCWECFMELYEGVTIAA